MNYKKTILKTSLITFFSVLVAFIIFLMLMFFVFTKAMAGFCQSLGSYGVAANLYYKVYEKEDNLLYLYKAINLDIQSGNNENIIARYELFVGDDDYDQFMGYIKTENEQLNAGLLAKSSVLSEENYLFSNYIKALIKNNEKTKAGQKAVASFVDYTQYNFDDLGFYAFNHFVLANNLLLDFNITFDGFSESLKNEIQNYFDNCYQLFDSKKNVTSSLDKAYLIALGSRVIAIGQDINQIYNLYTENSALILDNETKMTEINEHIKGILNEIS